MEKVIVACVQQRLRLHENLENCQKDLTRFFRMAQAKRAELVVFPELIGTITVPPMLQGLRASLMRQVDQAKRPKASLFSRARGKVAQSTAGMLKADLRQSLTKMLADDADQPWQTYLDLFGSAARQYGVTVVAGSGYFQPETGAAISNQAVVFGPDGEVVGRQEKVCLGADDAGLASPGLNWTPIDTEVGRLGILLGVDALYPEAGRILAYEGAQMIIGLGAAPGPGLHRKIRAGVAARVQENQLYGLVSFLVGPNTVGLGAREDFAGQSAIFAPAEFTPQHSGVMIQVGTPASEGLITAEWDFEALEELWDRSEPPLRREMPIGALQQLGGYYSEARTVQAAWMMPKDDVVEDVPDTQHIIPVEDLPEVSVAPAEPEAVQDQQDISWSDDDAGKPGAEEPMIADEETEEDSVHASELADAVVKELLDEDDCASEDSAADIADAGDDLEGLTEDDTLPDEVEPAAEPPPDEAIAGAEEDAELA